MFGSPLVREGYVFVDFFFVLSGFVIAHAYGDRLAGGAELRDFLVRRIGRLWPLHLATLAAVLGLECVLSWLASQHGLSVWPTFVGGKSVDLLLPNMLLVHSWALLKISWNGPSWSVSAELLAYVVFGVTLVLARHRTLVVAACILGFTWFISLSLAPYQEIYTRLPGLHAICGFFAGVLVHGAFEGTGRPNWPRALGTTFEVAAVFFVIAFIASFGRPETTPWATPIFAVAIYVFAAERGALSALLRTSPFQLIGQLSYSIYLTHFVVITSALAGVRLIGETIGLDITTHSATLFPSTLALGTNWIHVDADDPWLLIDFGNLWLNDFAVLAVLATVIGLSAITWRWVELPGQRLFAVLSGRSDRHRSASKTSSLPVS